MSQNRKPINRLNDVLMKYVFAREEQKAVTLSLINAVFAVENYTLLEDFQFLDRELDPRNLQDKEVRLDILGRSSDGTSVNVEVQVDGFSWMTKRILYYWARRYALKRGETYGNLARTVSIAILNYVLFPELPHEYHHAFAVQHTKHPERHFTDDLEIHCIELPKFEQQRGDVASLNPLGKWLAYFSKKTSAADLEAIAMQDPMIHQAVEAEHDFMQNPDFVSAYDIAEKAERDRYAREQFVRDEGLAKGLAQGRAEGWRDGKAEVAQNLLHLGMPVTQISEATGLSTAEIEALRKVQ